VRSVYGKWLKAAAVRVPTENSLNWAINRFCAPLECTRSRIPEILPKNQLDRFAYGSSRGLMLRFSFHAGCLHNQAVTRKRAARQRITYRFLGESQISNAAAWDHEVGSGRSASAGTPCEQQRYQQNARQDLHVAYPTAIRCELERKFLYEVTKVTGDNASRKHGVVRRAFQHMPN
jgi:hypothetical protein